MDREERSGPSLTVICLVALLLAPVAYLLSAGPVEWLMAQGYASYDNRVIDAFYYPGVRLMEICPPLDRFVRQYLSFWK
jgi:hypothetical protein